MLVPKYVTAAVERDTQQPDQLRDTFMGAD